MVGGSVGDGGQVTSRGAARRRWRGRTAVAAGGALALSLLVAPVAAANPEPPVNSPSAPGSGSDGAGGSGAGGIGDSSGDSGGVDGTPGIPGFVIKYASNVVAPLSADAPVPGAAAAGVELRPGAPVGLGWYEADLATPVDQQSAQEIAARLMTDPAIEYAEPQLWMRPSTTGTPDDPRWPQQWGFASYGNDNFVYPADVDVPLDRQTTGSNLLEALNAPRGDAPTVAVIDTGVINHPDLAGRLTTGYNFISEPARAGNDFGRGPNFYDPGDWVTAEQAASNPFSLTSCLAPDSSSWHGTHVSGTIAALTDNNLGIAGTLPAEIQTLRALGRCGGTSGDIAAAMLWASGGNVPGVPANPSPARVVNMSLGGGGLCPQHYQDVIDYGNARGTVFVVAAGNENTNAAFSTPANCAGVITVAATDPYGGRAVFSNYGAFVDVAAPGTGIMSTLDSGLEGPQTPNYAQASGTSMAAPHVAGAVAMLLAAESTLTPSQVRDRVKSTATPFKEIANFGGAGAPANNPAFDCVDDDPCGAGYLNTAALLGEPTADAPVIAPRFQVRDAVDVSTTGDTAALNGGSVAVRFAFKPSPSGPDDYLYSVAHGDTVLTEGATTDTDVSVTVPGTTGDKFTVLITPRTGTELGVASQAMQVPSLDGAAPPVPTIVNVSTTDTAAVITVNNTFSVPKIEATTVTAEPGGFTCPLVFNLTASSCMIPGLTTGVEYTFTATSSNDLGTSAPSAPVTATPQEDSPPSAPSIQSVVVQGNSATVTWTPSIPAGGREIAAYNVGVVGASMDQAASCTVVGKGAPPQVTFCQVPNLYVGESYQFVAIAVDDSGKQSQSAPSALTPVGGTPVPPSEPLAPPNVEIGDSMATVGLSAPALFNGGTPIIGARIVASPGGASCDLPWAESFVSRCTITGLTNGRSYTFTALVYNEMGGSPPSDPTVPLIVGEPAPTGELTVLEAPVRVLDTRTGAGPVQPGSPITVDVDAPEGAIAVAYNLTITGTTGAGYATLYPAGEEMPETSVSNWATRNQTVANGYVSGLGEAGAVEIAVAGTAAQAVLDVVGYYAPPVPLDPTAGASGAADPTAASAVEDPAPPDPEIGDPPPPGSRFLPMPPVRAYDSRTGDGPLAGGASRTVDLAAMLPAGAKAVAYTITQTGTTGSGYLSVGLPGAEAPTTSVLNWSGPNQTVANSSTAAVNEARQLEVFAGGDGSTQFVVDVLGYFASEFVSPDGLLFTPITPTRAYDSRVDTPGGPLTGGLSRTTGLALTVPLGAPAVAANLTATGTTGSGWLALTPAGTKEAPGISTLNWMQPNSTLANGTVTGAIDDAVTTFAAGGSTQYILDVAGYYHRPRS